METRQILGNEKYIITIDGNCIYNTSTNRAIKMSEQQIKDKPSGYIYVTLLNGNDYYMKRIAVHRLVLIAFTGIEEGKPWVNHKDGNRSNNHLDNLEWTTIGDNIRHSYDVLGRKMPNGVAHWNYGKKVSAITRHRMALSKLGIKHPKFKGWYIVNGSKFESANQAAKSTGLHSKSISRWAKANQRDCYFLPSNSIVL